MKEKILKLNVLSSLLISVLLSCGGSSSSGDDSNSYSNLSISISFIDRTIGTLLKQQLTTFPEGVDIVEIDVCETPKIGVDYRNVEITDICQWAAIPKERGTLSFTFEGLESGKEYTVGVIAYNKDGVVLYAGGSTIVLNPGDNIVNVIAVQLPPFEEYKTHLLRLWTIFYDFKQNVYDFYLDVTYYKVLGFEPIEVGYIFRADATMQIISNAEDNGLNIPIGQVFIVPDDGKHFDFDAGDGKYNLRLKFISGTSEPVDNTVAYVKLKEPYGNTVYDLILFEYNDLLPRIYSFDRAGNVTIETSNGDLIWELGESIYINHTLNSPVGVVICLENSKDTINIDELQGDVFETLFLSGKVYCHSYFTNDFTNSIEFTSDQIEDVSFLVNIFADKKYFGFDQIRFFVIDKVTGTWQVSAPIHF